MIEEVECLSSKLELFFSPDREGPDNGGVQIDKSLVSQGVGARISIGILLRDCEGRRIEPLPG
jgi:hypothetical protein